MGRRSRQMVKQGEQTTVNKPYDAAVPIIGDQNSGLLGQLKGISDAQTGLVTDPQFANLPGQAAGLYGDVLAGNAYTNPATNQNFQDMWRYAADDITDRTQLAAQQGGYINNPRFAGILGDSLGQAYANMAMPIQMQGDAYRNQALHGIPGFQGGLLAAPYAGVAAGGGALGNIAGRYGTQDTEFWGPRGNPFLDAALDVAGMVIGFPRGG